MKMQKGKAETLDRQVDFYYRKAIEAGRRVAETPFNLLYKWVVEYEGNPQNFKSNAITAGACALVDVLCYMTPGSQWYVSIPVTIGALVKGARAAKDKNVY